MAAVSSSLILVADDDLTTQWVLQVLLQNEGYSVRTARTGPEALRLAGELVPDLILLDAALPDLGGFDVCRQLRGSGLHDVPIAILASTLDRTARARGLAMGVDDFISKPFDEVELVARVRTMARLRRSGPARMAR